MKSLVTHSTTEGEKRKRTLAQTDPAKKTDGNARLKQERWPLEGPAGDVAKASETALLRTPRKKTRKIPAAREPNHRRGKRSREELDGTEQQARQGTLKNRGPETEGEPAGTPDQESGNTDGHEATARKPSWPAGGIITRRNARMHRDRHRHKVEQALAEEQVKCRARGRWNRRLKQSRIAEQVRMRTGQHAEIRFGGKARATPGAGGPKKERGGTKRVCGHE